MYQLSKNKNIFDGNITAQAVYIDVGREVIPCSTFRLKAYHHTDKCEVICDDTVAAISPDEIFEDIN